MLHFFTTFIDSFPLFVEALGLTLALTCVALIFALPLGVFSAFLGRSRIKMFKLVVYFYTYLVRGTPLIVQMFILYFGLTNLVKLNNFLAAAIALAFHNGAYIGEMFRGSLDSISQGQFDAAKSLGMNSIQTYRRIILPQAFKRVLPGLGNQFIIALKDSSLAAFISMNELFNVATTLGSNHFDQMTYLLIVSTYYLLLVFLLTQFVQLLERRYYFAE